MSGKPIDEAVMLEAFQDAMESAHGYRPQVFATGVLINSRDADRFEGYQLALTAAQQHGTSPDSSLARRVEGLEAALRPFADLARLFDDDMRGGNMPSKDEHPIAEWPRIDRTYGFTVGDVRRARAALSHPAAGDANGGDGE